MQPILLHPALPPELATPRPLPGTRPLAMADWLHWDATAPAQLALRRRLLAQARDQVLATLPEAQAACAELEALVHDLIAAGPWPAAPQGEGDPLARLGHQLPEDLCILQKRPGERQYRLTAACLCFPASWLLSEKLGHPLDHIHGAVSEYPEVSRRVDRLFDGIQPGRALWRSNWLRQDNPALFQPRSVTDPRPAEPDGTYIRVERQCLLRLPQSGAMVFSIATFVVRA